MTVLQTADGRLLPAGIPPTRAEYIVLSGGPGAIDLAGPRTATYELIYEQNPIAAAVINKLVRQIATMPIKTYDRPPGEPNPELVPDHPVAKLLRTPAPRRGPTYWKQGLARGAMVHGNGLLAKWRGPGGAGLPQALLPCAWPWTFAYAPLGAPVEWWATYQTGTQRYFRDDDAVHFAWESGNLNGLGVSPLKQLAATLSLDDAERRYQAAMFQNGARPSGGVSPPPGFVYQDGQREELERAIQRSHGGVDNAGLMVLLGPGFTWAPFSHTAVEAEIIAARGLNREEVAMVYDIPPPMIGDLTHGTYSNVEELHRILYVTTLRPWFSLIEEILQAQLIDVEPEWEGVYVQFDLAEVLRGNRREEIDAAAQAFTNGLMTLNEVREMLELPKIDPASDPEGMADMPHIPANNLQPLIADSADNDEETAPPGVDPNQTKQPGGYAAPAATRKLAQTPSSGE